MGEGLKRAFAAAKATRKPRAVKPKGPTARRRAAKRQKQMGEDRYVYGAVDARDGLKSRLSGIYGGNSIERHHIVYRSQGGKTTTANVISLTQREHQLVHAKQIDIRFRDPVAGADGIVDFYMQDQHGWREAGFS